MSATRQQIHTLVDMVEDIGLDTLYSTIIQFIPETAPLPDEIISHAVAQEEIQRGEVYRDDEIDWNAPLIFDNSVISV